MFPHFLIYRIFAKVIIYKKEGSSATVTQYRKINKNLPLITGLPLMKTAQFSVSFHNSSLE
jgi:hypothetical protein